MRALNPANTALPFYSKYDEPDDGSEASASYAGFSPAKKSAAATAINPPFAVTFRADKLQHVAVVTPAATVDGRTNYFGGAKHAYAVLSIGDGQNITDAHPKELLLQTSAVFCT
ncbi:hypothetical protein MRX96_009674 [Rhipicephalus microplus]